MAGRIAYYGGIVKDGLILDLDAAKKDSYIGTGNTWSDISGNRYIGSLINGPTFSSDNGGLFFNGINSYISVPGINTNNEYIWTPNNSVGSSILCYEIWFRTSDPTGYFISKPWNGSGQYNFSVTPSRFRLESGVSGTTAAEISLSSLTNNTWKQLVIWANSTTMGYYVNGITQTGSTLHNLTGGTPSSGNANLMLVINSLYPYGEGWAGNTNFSISGNTNIVRRYNKILTAQQVLQNYNATKGRFGL